MIVYTGNGPMVFVGLLILVAMSLPVMALTQAFPTHPALPTVRIFCFLTGCGVAGLWCWWVGRWWNKAGNVHTVYGVPCQYYAFAYWGLALVAVVHLGIDWAEPDSQLVRPPEVAKPSPRLLEPR